MLDSLELNRTVTKLRLEGNEVVFDVLDRIEALTRRNASRALDNGEIALNLEREEKLEALKKSCECFKKEVSRLKQENASMREDNETGASLKLKLMERDRFREGNLSCTGGRL